MAFKHFKTESASHSEDIKLYLELVLARIILPSPVIN